MPRPGPSPTRTSPSRIWGMPLTRSFRSGDAVMGYSTIGAASALAIQWAEAARLTPVPKLCGRHQTERTAAMAERRRQIVGPPARPISGWITFTPRSSKAAKSADTVTDRDTDQQHLLRPVGFQFDLGDAEVKRLDGGDLQIAPVRWRLRRRSKRRL
jgi:hypothetical protein